MIIVLLLIRVLRVLIATSLSVPINCQVLSYLQMDSTIPNIAGTAMLGPAQKNMQ